MAYQLLSVLYIVFLVAYGLRKGGRAKSFREFTGAATQPSLLVITASMCASFIGGGFSLGNAERAYASGIANTLLLMGFSLGQILVGVWLAPKFSRFAGTSTVGGILGKAYGDNARILSGILSVIFCTGVLGAQINAIGTVAGALFSLPPKLCATIGCIVIVLYSALGGLKASLKSDAIQIFVLAVGLPLALYAALRQVGGFRLLFAQIPVAHSSPLDGHSSVEFGSLFLTFMLGEMLCPPAAQRLLLSTNPKRTRSATVLSGGVSVPFFMVTGAIGLCALALRTTNIQAFAMPSLINAVLPGPLGAVVCAAMLCVYLSSGGSFLNSCASSLCEDVIGPLRSQTFTDQARLRAARMINVVCGCAALVVAVSLGNVLSILVLSYSFWAPIILIPLIFALKGNQSRPFVFFVSAFCAAAALVLWRIFGEPLGISPIIVGLLVNGIALWICHAAVPQPAPAAIART